LAQLLPYRLFERGAAWRDGDRVERIDFAREVCGQREMHAARVAPHAVCIDEAGSAHGAVDDDGPKRADRGFYLGKFSCHANVLRRPSRTDPDTGRISCAVSG